MAQQFEQLNTNGHLVQDFVKRYGYPVWDKSRQLKKQFTATAKGNADDNDTIIIIPVVVPNIQEVKTYIEATLSDTITLAVHTAVEYKYLPFSKDSSKIIGAEKMAIRFMLLNWDVFNHRSFRIIDNRLFNGASSDTDTSKRNRKIVFPKRDTATKLSNNINVGGLLQNSVVCLKIQNGHCTCDNPSRCDMCDECAYTLCLDYEYDDGTGDGLGGYGDIPLGGGSSGGGGSTNPEPCTGGGLINGLGMPCDPTNPPTQPPGGIGWVPIEDDSNPLPPYIFNNLTKQCLNMALSKLSGGASNTFFKQIYNTFDTSTINQLFIQEANLADTAYGLAYSGVTLPTYGTSFTIVLDTVKLLTCSQEWMAYVIIHEVAHAAMDANVIKWDTANSQHYAMAGQYLTQIANSLMTAYPKLPEFDAYAICFAGFFNGIEGHPTPEDNIFSLLIAKKIAQKFGTGYTPNQLADFGRNYTETGTKGFRGGCN